MTAVKRKSLTLVEIIITASLVAVVGIAVFSAVSSGLKIWQRLTKSTIEEDVHIFFEKFGFDIRNSFAYEGIDFSGSDDSLTFASLVSGSGFNLAPGQVTYHFYPEGEVVTSEKRTVTNLFRDKPGIIERRLEDVQALSFSYYFYDPLRKEYFWVSDWEEDRLPLAVRINLEIKRDKREYKFSKTFNIPVGNNRS